MILHLIPHPDLSYTGAGAMIPHPHVGVEKMIPQPDFSYTGAVTMMPHHSYYQQSKFRNLDGKELILG